jgi:hypothetical protein
MIMEKRTPGPWHVRTDGPCPYGNAEIGATVGDMPVTIGSTDIANARLITAAPDLLDALSWFINDIDGTHTKMVDFDDNVSRSRAAIAKAIGAKVEKKEQNGTSFAGAKENNEHTRINLKG